MTNMTEGDQTKQHSSWTKFSCSFDSAGKKHILPLNMLRKLVAQVVDRKDFFTSLILQTGLKSLCVSPPQAAICEDIDNGGNDIVRPTQPKRKKKAMARISKFQKKKKADDLTCEDAETEEESGSDRKRPNYFVAVQINDPQIQDVARKIQMGIQEKSKVNLKQAIIGVEKFHITLMVMHLPNEEEVKKAVESLDKCKSLVQDKTCGEPVTLTFKGLSTFSGGRVLFASVQATNGLQHLKYMADEVSTQMKNTGIASTDKEAKQFNPHLTLIKFTGQKALRKQGITKLKLAQYEQYENEIFGSQVISSLQLCNMNKKRQDGYYLVEHEVFFNDSLPGGTSGVVQEADH